MDIIDFLKERIDEDETRARLAAEFIPTESGWWRFTARIITQIGTDQEAALAFRHIDKNSPARVLAECAAKRGILVQWAAATEDGEDDSTDEIASGIIIALRDVLRTLVAAYKDHPDYQQEWSAKPAASPFQARDRVTHPSRPGMVGTLEPPLYVLTESEPHFYVHWDDGQGTRVDPANLAHAEEKSADGD
ncbi:hypothetical protein HYQ00_gp80 [Arthrobacter phage TripleJ]|uniref:Uncharacterized protein n=1 Tax=Arthrobacter phage TripleJ TaxID=2599838 RepID=A0A5J6THV2_9CAUD|nr:hypothetical protein HYQ00_gp80 [Arthrobacter phage TripleJ]QFG09624.1 hypothetical protein PBI_TRIPLEJ_80 [Arthrobacter phage TripleJ]